MATDPMWCYEQYGEAAEYIDELEARVKELEDALDNAPDIASKALRKAWQLGQTYWQQADSDYESQWKKSDATQAAFQQLVDDTRAALAKEKP